MYQPDPWQVVEATMVYCSELLLCSGLDVETAWRTTINLTGVCRCPTVRPVSAAGNRELEAVVVLSAIVHL